MFTKGYFEQSQTTMMELFSLHLSHINQLNSLKLPLDSIFS